MYRLCASLRFDDAARNLDEAVALQCCSAREYGSIEATCLDGDKKKRMAPPWQDISLTARADRSVMSIECTALGACSEGPRRKYERRAGLAQMDSVIQLRSVVGLRQAMKVVLPHDYQNVALQLSRRPGAARF
jgi:hypothetical protein